MRIRHEEYQNIINKYKTQSIKVDLNSFVNRLVKEDYDNEEFGYFLTTLSQMSAQKNDYEIRDFIIDAALGVENDGTANILNMVVTQFGIDSKQTCFKIYRYICNTDGYYSSISLILKYVEKSKDVTVLIDMLDLIENTSIFGNVSHTKKDISTLFIEKSSDMLGYLLCNFKIENLERFIDFIIKDQKKYESLISVLIKNMKIDDVNFHIYLDLCVVYYSATNYEFDYIMEKITEYIKKTENFKLALIVLRKFNTINIDPKILVKCAISIENLISTNIESKLKIMGEVGFWKYSKKAIASFHSTNYYIKRYIKNNKNQKVVLK